MKRFALFAVLLLSLAFAGLLAIKARAAEPSTRVIPSTLHLQTTITCPNGAIHCAQLTWNAGVGGDAPTGYNVYRAITSTGCGTLTSASCSKVGSPAAPTTTYTDSPLTAGQQYFYVVTAFNSAGESGPSNQVSVTPAVTAPNAPTNLTGQVK